MNLTFVEAPAARFAAAAANLLADELSSAIEARGVAHLALSGGRSPWVIFGHLAELDVDWAKTHIWQVDERVAPDRDVDRNSVGLRSSFLSSTPIPEQNIHLMDVTSLDCERAAANYAADLARTCEGILDCVHLGLGVDGHTASWPPHDPILEVMDRDVAMTGEYNGYRRMSLTVPCVNRARQRLFTADSEEKLAALAALRAADPAIPASRVTHTNTRVLVSLPDH